VPEFVAGAADDGSRLDIVVASRSGLSRAAVQRMIAAGTAQVGGRRAAKHHVVRRGERIAYVAPAAPSPLESETVPYRLVYEDDAVLVVDKPAGVVVHPAPGHEHGTLVQGLLDRGIAGGHELRPGVVHRLDKDTSGLLIVARTPVAHRRLVEALARREIRRRYLALACGDVPHDEGEIDVPIGRHLRDRKRMSVHSGRPRPAVTRFTVRDRLPGYTLLDVTLETGRTHQIRVHLAALGHPVAGDVTYGLRRRPEGLPRQFLHASGLAFRHPMSGEEMAFESPPPDDLRRFLAALGGGGERGGGRC